MTLRPRRLASGLAAAALFAAVVGPAGLAQADFIHADLTNTEFGGAKNLPPSVSETLMRYFGAEEAR